MLCLLICLTFGLFVVAVEYNPCALRNLGNDRYVCVCNATYCDNIQEVGSLRYGEGILYYSSRNGKRLLKSRARQSANKKDSNILITLNPSKTYQEIIGFGGAFTDSVGINLKKLPKSMQDSILEGYYGKSGLQYTTGRVPMASCDFSIYEYSYDDIDQDFALKFFNLTTEDLEYKIPYILKAQLLSRNTTRFFSTPWSAPAWMKTNGRMRGGGKLKGLQDGIYYNTWANYFVRFFEEYHKNGVDFWGLTVQNEPTSGLDPNWKWQTMYFSAAMERDFVKNHLGPALKTSPYSINLKLMINDDQRFNLPHWADTILSDPETAQYVSGIAIHWYEDFVTPAHVLTLTHERHPDYFMLATEASAGYLPLEHKPIPGDWARAEQYVKDMIVDITNWVSGWTDWNLCLDMNGGPNFAKNFVDSPILVDSKKQEYYKQPMWYALGHFSKFVRPGSFRIESTTTSTAVHSIAFMDSEGYRILVAMNTAEKPHDISVNEKHNPLLYFTIRLEPHTIVTLVFN